MSRVTRADLKTVDYRRTIDYLTALIVILGTNVLCAQQESGISDSSRIPAAGLTSYLVSDKLSWYSYSSKFDLHELELRHAVSSYQSFLNQSLSNFKFDPFTTDYRQSSYYVPAMVRDELNLIMNRPRDSAFLPVFGIAWIAYTMASHYLEIKRKTDIGYHEILAARPALPVLYRLWQYSPQTARQLYRQENIFRTMTFVQLLQNLELLQDNNLVKSRICGPDSVTYYPGLQWERLLSILDAAGQNPQVTDPDRRAIDAIRSAVPAKP